MDILLMFNGLGNQLSQHAFYLKKRRLGQCVRAYYAFGGHNGYELGRLFDIHQEMTWPMHFARLLFRVGNSRRLWSKPLADAVLGLFRIHIVYESPDYRFDAELLKPWFGLRFLVGGWHDSRYFHGIEHEVRNALRFPELDEHNLAVIRRIGASYSVSIHIRRGDYLDDENHRLFGNIATMAYYRNAIAEATAQSLAAGATPSFFIFSDDMVWCREALDLPAAEFVNINSGKDSWKDLYLMSRCRINILANSTFSWWAAWLNQQPDKIIFCPTRFISTDRPEQSIYPSTWRKVPG
jgi:hypothetical protein